MSAPKLVKFDAVAGVPCYYARTNAAYGDLSKCTKSRVRQLAPMFLKCLEAMVMEIDLVCYGVLGELQAVTSGGAYVAKAGWHGEGRAYDLGGLHWKQDILTTLEVARNYHRREGDVKTGINQYLIYLAVESVIRKHFGTVLGIHYDDRHWNHWHFDPGTEVGYWPEGFGAGTRVRYLQEVLTYVWRIPHVWPDGDEGPKTRRGIEELRAVTHLGPLTHQNVWLQFLTLTSLKAMQLR